MRACIIGILLGLLPLTGFAKARLVNGAGTLPQGDWAVGLDLGIDIPAPALYSVNAHYGATDWLQVGLHAGSLVLINDIGMSLAANVFTSADERHLLGLRVSPTYLYIKGVWWPTVHILSLPANLAYEYRFGEERKTGLFVTAGTVSNYLKAGGKSDEFLFISATANQSFWAHGWRGSVGVQHLFGERFSLTAEAAGLATIRFKNPSPAGRLGFTWAF